MRELKFRAWHKGFKDGKINIEPVMLLESYSGEAFNWKHQRQQIEIMQFTGLLDKNGKEIYEGDVVRVQGLARKGIYTTNVIFKAPQFKLAVNETKWNDWASFTGVEVIGNIYENPELVKL